jgi:hypothetical protein
MRPRLSIVSAIVVKPARRRPHLEHTGAVLRLDFTGDAVVGRVDVDEDPPQPSCGVRGEETSLPPIAPLSPMYGSASGSS